MTHSYKATHSGRHWRKLALLGLLSLGYQAAQAQTPVRYAPSAVQNVAGTYTDLGTTGTAITTANTDDDNSAATPLGFTFQFNGQSFNDFVLNTNGIIRLGTAAPSATNLFGVYENGQAPGVDPITSTSTADVNLIAPFNFDLEAGSATGGTEYRVATTGTAPNRVTTIQWKNVSDKAGGNAKQYASFNFQVRLYETTNNIEFVYGPAVAATTGTDIARYPTVGIKGSGSAAGQTVLGNRTSSAAAWSTTAFITGVYTTSTHNFRRSTTPDVGRTYRFRPQLANDARPAFIYTLGKLPTPAGTPHSIQARVTNAGSEAQTNLSVTATVSGANSFTNTKTIPTLAAGASTVVTFDAFSPTQTGTNTIRVVTADDQDNTNNTATTTQLVNATTFAYTQQGVAPTSSVGFNTGSGILANKYTTSIERSVSAVTVRLADANSVGKTVYGVVLSSVGAILGRSANYTITAADINADKTFTLPVPVNVAPGSFLVGLAQVASSVGFFPIAFQGTESPLRSDAYFEVALNGGTPSEITGATLGTFMIEAVTGAPITCFSPSDVAISAITSTSAVVTFSAPNANGTAYTIIYGPRGFDPATGGTRVPATPGSTTLNNLMVGMPYDVYVRTNCGATEVSFLLPPVQFFTLCISPRVTAFPYTQNFDNAAPGELSCGVTVANVNGDTRTWTPASTDIQGGAPASAPYHMRYIYSPNFAADDWFFLPAMTLQAGFTYQVAFKYKAAVNNSSEKLEVKYGTATTPAGQTNLLWRNESITNTTYATTTAGTAAGQVLPITPTTTGTYYVGFRVFSDANQYNLYVDDVTVTATAVTSSSAALLRAISVFPNPSAGKLSIEVSNANARNGLQVEISNMVGQRVHTATIRDNMTNQLDLSGLANGMYVVKVRNGNEYMVRNISIQK
ncbi:T9SS type A sorting domain-containing protein [Hymenobacter sp. UYP22]|uniref:T9SS type A sorting domain-containing protein n=1 Tax=Hymenobacter sp. UYP22 TaxID=3156348 RepID=UPI003396B5D2